MPSLFRVVGKTLAVFALLVSCAMIAVPSVEAGMCNCLCASSLGSTAPGGPACQNELECTYSGCSTYCAGFGAAYTPGRNASGSRSYACVGGATIDSPAMSAEEDRRLDAPPTTGGGAPAPAAGRAGSAGSGGSSGSGAAATPRTSTPTTASEGGGSSARFSLPACTNDGNCSLTDIVNTGVRFANFLMGIAGMIFLATFLWAGAQLLIFAQDAKSYGKAQEMMKGAVLGIVIIMVAGVAVRFVSSSAGVNASFLRMPGRTQGTPPPSSGIREPASAPPSVPAPSR